MAICITSSIFQNSPSKLREILERSVCCWIWLNIYFFSAAADVLCSAKSINSPWLLEKVKMMATWMQLCWCTSKKFSSNPCPQSQSQVILERSARWNYSSSFTVFKGQIGENIHKLFITSKDFPVQKMNFTTWETKRWKHKIINHKVLLKTNFSIYRVLIPLNISFRGKAKLQSTNNDAEKIAFLVPLKQISFVFIH